MRSTPQCLMHQGRPERFAKGKNRKNYVQETRSIMNSSPDSKTVYAQRNPLESDPAPGPDIKLTRMQMAQAVAVSCLGWSFDLFDLFIILYVAPILAHTFFDSASQMLSLAAVYGAFTATLIMRPVGGWFFGRYSDRHGRKRTLVTAAVGVGVSTACMGLLPTYHSIGIAAPTVFLLLRLIQGVFMGGMVAATHTLGTESIGPGRRGLASGIISGGGSGIGKLFASLVFVLVSTLIPGPLFAVWGWRVMFFSGLVSSLLGLFVFTRLQESPLWLALAAQKHKKTLPQRTLKGYGGVIVSCVLLTLTGGGLSYLTSGYLPTFLKIVNHLPATTIGLIMSVSGICVIAASVLSGALTDYIGRRRAMLLYGVVSLVTLPLLYLALRDARTVFPIAACAVALSAIGTFCYAPLLIVLNERFPTAIRSTGTAVSWNIGFAIGGSLPSFVSLAARRVEAVPVTLAIATALVSLIYLLTTWCLRENQRLM